MGGAVLASASPAAGGTVAAVVGVEVVVAAAATVDVCGEDTAAPANVMGFWPNRTLFAPCFTAFEQSAMLAMNCVRTFTKFSFSY